MSALSLNLKSKGVIKKQEYLHPGIADDSRFHNGIALQFVRPQSLLGQFNIISLKLTCKCMFGRFNAKLGNFCHGKKRPQLLRIRENKCCLSWFGIDQ